MTRFLLDVASYQGTLKPADVKRAGFTAVNLKTSHELGQKAVHPDITDWVTEARALGLGIGTFHWLTGGAPGTAQATYAYGRLTALGLTKGTAHTVDCEADASLAIVTDYCRTMTGLLGRPIALYTGDWWWTAPIRDWKGSGLTPYLWAAPNAGYLPTYPGDTSPHWAAGYGGWPALSVMQYAVQPLIFPDGSRGTINVSKSAVRDETVWTALTGGTVATSQNGWTVDTSGSLQDRGDLVPGVSAPNGIRQGDVATVLRHVAQRFHREVEPLHAGWCWGWFVKVIEGGSSYSNHASGTAIDLNAPDHPLGSRGTFTAAKVTAIRKILADLGGVVRWGGDYTQRADEMHFEIIKGAAAVKTLADAIRAQEGDMPLTEADVKTFATAKIWPAPTGITGPMSLQDILVRLYNRTNETKGLAGDTKTLTGGVSGALSAYIAAEATDDAAKDRALAALQQAVDAMPVRVLDMLGDPAVPSEKIAAALTDLLGDRAAEVGRLLAAAGTAPA